eukprot:TRINITY_DN6461_c0_g1_i1.p1 TRINITY_DN6461_c0_g1~~TRINITY_DN6461_c0_g1_i1.p1  ORF type:complete len:479 (+),score=70.96 TRINITY_DN6461_c0_g1_i1:7-1443(+)
MNNRLCYITDVEGNLAYFKNCLSYTEDIFYEDTAETILALKDNVVFVHGGDTFDKGPWDIRFARQLIALKRRYPERVILIIGNRDLNKTKLSSELDEADIARPVESISGPWWVEEAERVTFKSFLKKMIEQYEGPVAEGQDYSADLYQKYHTRTTRIKWLLKHTMGCSETFEHRRTELSELENRSKDSISDEEVADDFYRQATSPDGVYRQYLELAQICYLHGNTIITHGAITTRGLFFIPGDDNQDAKQTPHQIEQRGNRVETLTTWVDNLNSWAAKAIHEWIKYPHWNSDRSDRGGRCLMGYGYVEGMKDYSVLINTHFEGGNPTPVSVDLAEKLHKFGVSRILVGHKPHGFTPTPIKGNGVEIIDADTSYSDPKKKDNRGLAASVVTITTLGDGTSYSTVKGVINDGTTYSYSLPPIDAQGTPKSGKDYDSLIGSCVDGWWVRAVVTVEKKYILSKAHGRSVEYKYQKKEELQNK